MKTKKRSTKSRISVFESYAEEARFWDTHDTTDFEDEFKPVQVRVAKKLSDGVMVSLDQKVFERVRSAARQSRVGPTTLIRRWVVEGLRQKEKVR